MFCIPSYNIHLASIGKDIDFSEYVKEVNKVSNSNINLSLMDMIDFHNRNECCIPHSFLYSFKLLLTKRGRYLTSDIIDFLKPYTEGKDYTIRHVSVKTGKKINIEDEFYIHPKAFKKMLINNNKNSQYFDYFLFLEDCMYLYSDYRKKLNNSKIIISNFETIDVSLNNIKNMVNNIETTLINLNIN